MTMTGIGTLVALFVLATSSELHGADRIMAVIIGLTALAVFAWF